MAIFETYSKRRRKREQAGNADVYQYDTLPAAFRHQIVWIWTRAIGPYYDGSGYVRSQGEAMYVAQHAPYAQLDEPLSNQVWDFIARVIAEEAGQLEIGQSHQDSLERCIHWLLSSDTMGAIDIIDLSFRIIDGFLRAEPEGRRRAAGAVVSPDDAITRLNLRFKEHNIGYEFQSGELIRIDEQFIHDQAVKPALALLGDPSFAGPLQEFLSAHQHYRKQETKDAIVDSANALESTMKTICSLRSITYSSTATAALLVKTLIDSGFLESFYENVLLALPTLRNKTTGAHGQGSQPVVIPIHVAAFALHLAASNIVFLIERHRERP